MSNEQETQKNNGNEITAASIGEQKASVGGLWSLAILVEMVGRIKRTGPCRGRGGVRVQMGAVFKNDADSGYQGRGHWTAYSTRKCSACGAGNTQRRLFWRQFKRVGPGIENDAMGLSRQCGTELARQPDHTFVCPAGGSVLGQERLVEYARTGFQTVHDDFPQRVTVDKGTQWQGA